MRKILASALLSTAVFSSYIASAAEVDKATTTAAQEAALSNKFMQVVKTSGRFKDSKVLSGSVESIFETASKDLEGNGFKTWSDLTAEKAQKFLAKDNAVALINLLQPHFFPNMEEQLPTKLSKTKTLAIFTSGPGMASKRSKLAFKLANKFDVEKIYFVSSTHKVDQDFLDADYIIKNVLPIVYAGQQIEVDRAKLESFMGKFSADNLPTHYEYFKAYIDTVPESDEMKKLITPFLKVKDDGSRMATADLLKEFKQHLEKQGVESFVCVTTGADLYIHSLLLKQTFGDSGIEYDIAKAEHFSAEQEISLHKSTVYKKALAFYMKFLHDFKLKRK